MSDQRQTDAIEHLLCQMTLPEKIGQMAMLAAEYAVTGPSVAEDYREQIRRGSAGSLLNLWGAERVRAVQRIAVEESRLGIPLFFGFDVIHGHRTVFPSPLGEASAFDPDLWRRTAAASASEAAADGIDLVFAPMLDVSRDPRWGRVMEGPGEDTLLASRLAVAKIEGSQGGDLRAPDRLGATAKHFVGYGAVTAGREYASVELSERTLREVHLPPFKAAVEAGVACVMAGFHDLAGVPMTANRDLLQGVLRRQWGFQGVILSDYGAIRELLVHGVVADLAEAAALALRAGIDIDMMGGAYAGGLEAALERGLVELGEIDDAVRRVLELKQRLGLLDDPYRRLGATPPPRSAMRELAREAARRSAVLLTNGSGVLPLSPTLRRIAMIGPLAANGPDLLGPWAGTGEDADPVTLVEGMRAALPGTEIVVGTDAGSAVGADLVLLCLGETREMSGEAASRGDLDLPGDQRALAESVLDLSLPVVAVLVSGRPLTIGWLASRASSVLALWHPGSEAGTALADLLTGSAEPTGRTPISWPASVGQIPLTYAERPSGRPYGGDPHFASQYIDQPNAPLFPFGHGLSYTRFRWCGMRVTPSRFGLGDRLLIEVELANEGARSGEETVLVFVHDKVAQVVRPVLELKAFGRLALAAGASGRLDLTIDAKDLAYPRPDFQPLLEPGEFEILAGPSADRTRLLSCIVELVG